VVGAEPSEAVVVGLAIGVGLGSELAVGLGVGVALGVAVGSAVGDGFGPEGPGVGVGFGRPVPFPVGNDPGRWRPVTVAAVAARLEAGVGGPGEVGAVDGSEVVVGWARVGR
jgi:hypothetical protein